MHRLTLYRVIAYRGREAMSRTDVFGFVRASRLARGMCATPADTDLDDGVTRADVVDAAGAIVLRVRRRLPRRCTCLAPPSEGHALWCARVLGERVAA